MREAWQRLFVSSFYLLASGVGCQYRPPDSWDTFASYGIAPELWQPPSASPDWRWIVFSSPRTGRFDIYRVSFDGGTLQRLTEAPQFECNPVFCPTGEKIFYQREFGGWRTLWVMDSDGSNERQLLGGDRKHYAVVDVSSNGERLLVQRSWSAGGLGLVGDVVVFDLRRRAIVATLPEASHAVFAGDGDVIALNRSSAHGIWLYARNGSQMRRIVKRGGYPLFTSDGRIVYHDVEDEKEGVGFATYILDPRNGSKRSLGYTSFPTVTSFAKLAWLPLDHRQVLEVLDIETGSRRSVAIPGTHASRPRACPGRDGVLLKTWSDSHPAGEIHYICFSDFRIRHICSVQ